MFEFGKYRNSFHPENAQFLSLRAFLGKALWKLIQTVLSRAFNWCKNHLYSMYTSGDSDDWNSFLTEHSQFSYLRAFVVVETRDEAHSRLICWIVDENNSYHLWSFHHSYRCIVPAINILTPLLDFGKCFVGHPYEMTVELMNDSDLPARYELTSQVRLALVSIVISRRTNPKQKENNFCDCFKHGLWQLLKGV